MDYRYYVSIFCGSSFCGCGEFNTLDEVYKFMLDDGFCDKAKVKDVTTEKTFTIKIK